MITALLCAIVVVAALVIWANLRRRKQRHERELLRVRRQLEAKEKASDGS